MKARRSTARPTDVATLVTVSQTYPLEGMHISVKPVMQSVNDLVDRLTDLSLSTPADILPSSDSDSDGEHIAHRLRNRNVAYRDTRPVLTQPSKSGSIPCSATNAHGERCGNRTLRGLFCRCHRRMENAVLAEAGLGWLQTETWNLLAGILDQPSKPADGKGYLYVAYLEGDDIPPNELHIKLGRSSDVSRRLREWKTRCSSCKRVPVVGLLSQRHQRLERVMLLVLTDLAKNQAYRVPGFPNSGTPKPTTGRDGRPLTKHTNKVCQDCGVVHIEHFTFYLGLPDGKMRSKSEVYNYIKRLLCGPISDHLDIEDVQQI